MGGLNANIILQAGQPSATPVNSFGQMYAQAMQAKQQRAMQSAQLQNQQMEAQQKQIELQQAQANQVQQQGVLQALQGTSGDVNAAIELLKKQGNPQAFVLEKHKADAEKATAELGQVQQKVAESKAKIQSENLGHVASLVQSLKDTPEALQPIKYAAARQVALSNGWATPDTLPEQWNPQTAQQVEALGQSAISAKDQLQMKLDQGKAAETTRHNLTTEGISQTNTDLTKQRDVNNAQNQLIERYQRDAELKQQQQYQNAELGMRKQGLALEGARVGMEGQRLKQQQGQDDPASTLSSGEKNMVDQIIKGETKMPPAGARNSSAARIRAAAFQLDPSLNDERYTVNQSFKGGKDANEIGGITRILGHLDQYAKQSDSLGNSAGLLFHLPNSAGIRQTTSAISEEFGKLVKGGALTQTEAAQREHDLLSPVKATRDNAINSLKDLMGSQFEAKFQKYKTATGQDLDTSKFFDAKTQQRLQKQGLNPGGGSSGEPGSVPAVGGSFNGEKVLKVTRIK